MSFGKDPVIEVEQIWMFNSELKLSLLPRLFPSRRNRSVGLGGIAIWSQKLMQGRVHELDTEGSKHFIASAARGMKDHPLALYLV